MTLNLADFDTKARDAIKAFWGNRQKARQKQIEAGRVDAGERAGVTAGKNLDGFVALILDVVEANGLSRGDVHRSRALVTLPGYFRSTKIWDLLVVRDGRLVAAIELKSHVGPSFGNNFNNRTEEAIGTAHDFNTAARDGAFGSNARPFVGWLMVVEDAPGSRKPVRSTSKHFPVFPVFRNASYLERYDTFCQRLTREQLYTAASAIASPRTATQTGAYVELSEMTGLKSFVRQLAAHVAAEAVR
jgi:hypothetical protein